MQALKHCSKKSWIPGLSQNETHLFFAEFTDYNEHPWCLTSKYSGLNLQSGVGRLAPRH